jgi:hypothetical protein
MGSNRNYILKGLRSKVLLVFVFSFLKKKMSTIPVEILAKIALDSPKAFYLMNLSIKSVYQFFQTEFGKEQVKEYFPIVQDVFTKFSEKGYNKMMKKYNFHPLYCSCIFEVSVVFLKGGMMRYDPDKPSVITKDKDTGRITGAYWMKKGSLHRDEGPCCIEYPLNRGRCRFRWFENGIEYRPLPGIEDELEKQYAKPGRQIW